MTTNLWGIFYIRTLIVWQEKTNWQKNNFIGWIPFPDKTSVSSYTSASGPYSGNDFIQSNYNHIIGSELYKWQLKDPNIQTTVQYKNKDTCGSPEMWSTVLPMGDWRCWESTIFFKHVTTCQTLCSRHVTCKLFAPGICST